MPPRVTKPHTIRDLGAVDSAELAARVAGLSDAAWNREDAVKENAFAMFHHTQHIVLRFIEHNIDPERHYSNPGWVVWRPLVEPVMQAAIKPYGFRQPVFAKAMFARLAAGAAIDPHFDGAGSNLRCHKIHVPLKTNPQALFLVREERCHLAAGRAYEVNNIVRHGAENGGSEERVHFIFEVFEGDYARTGDDDTSAARTAAARA